MKILKNIFIGLFAVVCGIGGPANVTVVAYTYDGADWVESARKVVDIHNNLILEEPATIPDGKEFYGWSTSQEWDEENPTFAIEGNFISYNKVKDHATNGVV